LHLVNVHLRTNRHEDAIAELLTFLKAFQLHPPRPQLRRFNSSATTNQKFFLKPKNGNRQKAACGHDFNDQCAPRSSHHSEQYQSVSLLVS
jgi:hypothetical protein